MLHKGPQNEPHHHSQKQQVRLLILHHNPVHSEFCSRSTDAQCSRLTRSDQPWGSITSTGSEEAKRPSWELKARSLLLCRQSQMRWDICSQGPEGGRERSGDEGRGCRIDDWSFSSTKSEFPTTTGIPTERDAPLQMELLFCAGHGSDWGRGGSGCLFSLILLK